MPTGGKKMSSTQARANHMTDAAARPRARKIDSKAAACRRDVDDDTDDSEYKKPTPIGDMNFKKDFDVPNYGLKPTSTSNVESASLDNCERTVPHSNKERYQSPIQSSLDSTTKEKKKVKKRKIDHSTSNVVIDYIEGQQDID